VTLLLSIGGLVLLAILLVLFVLSRIKVAGPNQAFIVTGRQGRQVTDATGVISRDQSGQKVVMGASVFVLPVVQKLHTMDLSSRRIPVGIRGAVSKKASSATWKASRSSRWAVRRTPSAPQRSASSTSSRGSTPSPRRCSPVRCGPSWGG
jgi:hypothetical protein